MQEVPLRMSAADLDMYGGRGTRWRRLDSLFHGPRVVGWRSGWVASRLGYCSRVGGRLGLVLAGMRRVGGRSSRRDGCSVLRLSYQHDAVPSSVQRATGAAATRDQRHDNDDKDHDAHHDAWDDTCSHAHVRGVLAVVTGTALLPNATVQVRIAVHCATILTPTVCTALAITIAVRVGGAGLRNGGPNTSRKHNQEQARRHGHGCSSRDDKEWRHMAHEHSHAR